MTDKIVADKLFSNLKIRTVDNKKSYQLIWHKAGVKKKKTIPIRYENESIVSIRKRAIKIFNELQDIEEGIKQPIKPKIKITYKELFNDYIDDCKVRDVATHTINQYQSLYDKYVNKELGNTIVKDVARAKVKEIFRTITKDTKYQANKYLKFMVASLNFAIDEEKYDIEHNVATNIKSNPERKHTTSYTEEEKFVLFDRLNKLENFRPSRIRSISHIWLLILTGARNGEIANAKRSQIKGNTIVIPFNEYKTGLKTGKDRVIYLSEHAMQIIDKLKEVFPNQETITGIKSAQKTWDIIRKECNISHIRLHDLRHSFATYCLSAGLGHRQVGTLLGHQSLASMQRYGEVIADVSKKNVQLANDLILPESLNS